ncbi:MAG: ferritin [Anaerolineales bacterium]|nr:ferritin [Anaerolineales bacterium]
MMINKKIAELMNAQIGHELGASNEYLQIATYFDGRSLSKIAKLFYEQAEEEREHAMKFVKFLVETGQEIKVPAIPSPRYDLDAAVTAFKMAVEWENKVTRLIYDMMDIAVNEKDYASQNFLQWFVDEQVEEVSKMEGLLSIVEQAGEQNLLMLEAYLSH